MFLRTLTLLLALLVALPALAQDWTGSWDSRWRTGGARLTLTQQDGQVTGTYTPYDGRIEARVEGLRLVGEWIEGERRGGFEFALSRDGTAFTGRFDSGEWWTGRRLAADHVDVAVDTGQATPRDTLRSFLRLVSA